MAIRADHPTSRDAKTFYEVIERFRGFAAIKLMPKTGRTHQLRVHLAHVGCPVLCDRLYSGRSQLTFGDLALGESADGKSSDDRAAEIILSRQALHARRLAITHPISGEPIEFAAPLPDDMQSVLEALRQHRALGERGTSVP